MMDPLFPLNIIIPIQHQYCYQQLNQQFIYIRLGNANQFNYFLQYQLQNVKSPLNKKRPITAYPNGSKYVKSSNNKTPDVIIRQKARNLKHSITNILVESSPKQSKSPIRGSNVSRDRSKEVITGLQDPPLVVQNYTQNTQTTSANALIRIKGSRPRTAIYGATLKFLKETNSEYFHKAIRNMAIQQANKDQKFQLSKSFRGLSKGSKRQGGYIRQQFNKSLLQKGMITSLDQPQFSAKQMNMDSLQKSSSKSSIPLQKNVKNDTRRSQQQALSSTQERGIVEVMIPIVKDGGAPIYQGAHETTISAEEEQSIKYYTSSKYQVNQNQRIKQYTLKKGEIDTGVNTHHRNSLLETTKAQVGPGHTPENANNQLI